MIGSDLAVFVFVTLIRVQSEEICHRLRKLKTVPFKKIDDEMKTILQKHYDVIKCSKHLRKIFSFSLLLNFFGSSLMLCFDGLEAVKGENKINFSSGLSFLPFDLGQIFLLCFFGSNLVAAEREIGEAAYDSGWNEVKEKKVKTALTLIILRSQKPSFLTAGKFVNISLESFLTVSC
jgi:gustatory receptor